MAMSSRSWESAALAQRSASWPAARFVGRTLNGGRGGILGVSRNQPLGSVPRTEGLCFGTTTDLARRLQRVDQIPGRLVTNAGLQALFEFGFIRGRRRVQARIHVRGDDVSEYFLAAAQDSPRTLHPAQDLGEHIPDDLRLLCGTQSVENVAQGRVHGTPHSLRLSCLAVCLVRTATAPVAPFYHGLGRY